MFGNVAQFCFAFWPSLNYNEQDKDKFTVIQLLRHII